MGSLDVPREPEVSQAPQSGRESVGTLLVWTAIFLMATLYT